MSTQPTPHADLLNALEVSRLALGALRAYAPPDTHKVLNFILANMAETQRYITGTTTPEGNGTSDTDARQTLQHALAVMLIPTLGEYKFLFEEKQRE